MAAAGVAAVTCCADQTPKLPILIIKLIRSVVLGALDWPGAPGTSVQVLLLRTCHQTEFVILMNLERERITMIRWNKWTRDYTYTYLWYEGTWRLIHRKKNKPIVSWFGKMYSMFS